MKYIIFCAACLVLAVLFLFAEGKRKHIAGVCLKGLASLCFVMLGVLTSKTSQNAAAAQKVVTGLCLGCAADVLLNLRYILPKIDHIVFLTGILVFLTGHVMYILALAPLCSCLGVCLAAAAVLTAALIWWIFGKITAKPAFKVFGIFYLGVIMIMTCTACGILITAPSPFSLCFAIGALLFLASDIILILNTFTAESRESLRISNIILYYIGQLLIAYSLRYI